MGRFWATIGLAFGLAFGLLVLTSTPAHAADAQVYWQCKSGTGSQTGWCSASRAYPVPVEPGGVLYSHITTNATTTVKSGSGTLHSICVNTAGASSNVATVYDNTAGSGTVIAVLDTTAKGCYSYDLGFSTGLTIVTATGTAGDLTVTYR